MVEKPRLRLNTNNRGYKYWCGYAATHAKEPTWASNVDATHTVIYTVEGITLTGMNEKYWICRECAIALGYLW